MNSNIPTFNRFDKLHIVENTQNDTKIDEVIEIDVSKTRQIPFVKAFKQHSKEETCDCYQSIS